MYKIIGADQKQYGPVSADDMLKWIAEGRVNAQTLIQAEGQTDWRPLSSFPEFAMAAQPIPSGAPMMSASPTGEKIPNYLVQSILVTLCCCLPGGIAAIVYAAQVNSKQAADDIAGAMAASKNAKMWCWISLGVGLVINIGVVLLQVAAGGLAGMKH